MAERTLQELVRKTAIVFGFRHYHTHNSRRSEYGFPDSVLVKGSRLLVWELKTERGKLTPHQEAWLASFRQVPGVEVAVLRPSDWYSGRIVALLRGEG